MKKMILVVTTLGMFGSASAQVKFAAELGLGTSSLKSTMDNKAVESREILSFRGGGYAEMPLSDTWSVEAGLLYNLKGGTEYIGSNPTRSIFLNYIELPVNIKFNLPIGSGNAFAYAGPFVSYALSGKMRPNATTEYEKIEFGKGSAQMKQLDYGAQIGLGYRFSPGLYLRAQYSRGFNDLDNIETMKTINDNNFSLSVGWQF